MKKIIKVPIDTEVLKERLDAYLAKHIDLSRSRIASLVKDGKVLINDKLIQKASHIINNADVITVNYVATDISHITPIKMAIKVLYEDKDFILVNKPKNLVVHPGAGNYDNTLVNGLVHKYKDKLSDINGSFRPGVVHRLDKDTSGVLLIAKNNRAHAAIARQFEEHTIIRSYRALVWGVPTLIAAKISTTIARDKKNRTKMAITSSGKHKSAITNYKLIASYKEAVSLLDIKLETGRTHQIRAHMKHIGHNIIGDKVYGSINNKHLKLLTVKEKDALLKMPSQSLHAYRLAFMHPFLNKLIDITAPEPKELIKMYKSLKLQ